MFLAIAVTAIGDLKQLLKRSINHFRKSSPCFGPPTELTSSEPLCLTSTAPDPRVLQPPGNLHLDSKPIKETGRTSALNAIVPDQSFQKCMYCGLDTHPRKNCPARQMHCDFCKIRGHLVQVCRRHARLSDRSVPHPQSTTIATAARVPALSKAMTEVYVNGKPLNALVDTGSCLTFIDSKCVSELNLPVEPCREPINMASSSTVYSEGLVKVDLYFGKQVYRKQALLILPDLVSDIIIGHDILGQHERLIVNFDGEKEDISLAKNNIATNPTILLSSAHVDPPPLFSNLDPKCYPIACKSRKYSAPEQDFIRSEVARLLSEGKIEPSESPWRAQVLVTDLDSERPRLVIDYSRTINKFTYLDAYPLPKMDDIALKVSQFKVYSTFDLKSAYHQIPIQESDRPYTAFEGDGKLYQFRVIPFGVTNGVAKFQRTLDKLIAENGLVGTYAYLDNITVAGNNQEEHDINVNRFYEFIRKYRFTLNHGKSIISVSQINMLGYLISFGSIQPDPGRMKPLLDLPVPTNAVSLKRTLGLFSYYSQWLPKFSDMIYPLTRNPDFPLSEHAVTAFNRVKSSIVKASLASPNDTDLLVLESDASEVALSACLNQNGRPIAFFSRTLQNHERKHHIVEKEAAAIIESVKKWRHYLTGRKFLLITDQEAVSFIFNKSGHGKTKNNKIQRWRIDLSCFDFDIKYRPGELNVTADCLSRAQCASVSTNLDKLKDLHEGLCHPGITRLAHYVRSKNLPYSISDVKSIVSQCGTCARVKPQFYRPTNPPLIKATQPFERLSIDFKGPLPSVTQNQYFLTIVDEFSRFVFIYACKDMVAATVIKHLSNLFSVFGLASYIHSDNGPSLICSELRQYLLGMGIAYSNTSTYNPRGNGQCERYNGVVWKTIELACKSKDLPTSCWESVLPSVLHSLRSLLCVATNTTPHERLFNYQRRSTFGHSLPSWLLSKGSTVLLRRRVRNSKYEPLCDEVELIDISPSFAKVKLPSGREQSVSLRDLAPLPNQMETQEPIVESSNNPEGSSDTSTTTLAEDKVDTPLPIMDKASFTKNVFKSVPAESEPMIVVQSNQPPSIMQNYREGESSWTSIPSRATRPVERLTYSVLGGDNA